MTRAGSSYASVEEPSETTSSHRARKKIRRGIVWQAAYSAPPTHPEGLAASPQSSNHSEHLIDQLIPDDAVHTLKRWTTRMDTLTSINVFRQVVESGSFVGAADRLDLSTAMVSKHVMAIEKRLGVRLLNRNSHKLSLTEPGQVLSRALQSHSSGSAQDRARIGILELRAPRHLAYCVLRYLHPGPGVSQRAGRISTSLAGGRGRYLFRRSRGGPRGRELRSRLSPRTR